jgi:Fe-S-cluster containining protein
MHLSKKLLALFDEVQARSGELSAQHPSWPCTRGCGACCKSLARVPELTRSEWLLLEAALFALPEAEREACLGAARDLGKSVEECGEAHCVCPMFDASAQTCRVYEARPLACRSYGFYAGRSHDAWCNLVTEHVAEVRDGLVLGNLDPLEARLSRMDGERHDLLTWLARRKAG